MGALPPGGVMDCAPVAVLNGDAGTCCAESAQAVDDRLGVVRRGKHPAVRLRLELNSPALKPLHRIRCTPAVKGPDQ